MNDEWEVPRPPIKRRCKVCKPQDADVDENHVCVSPSGTAHFGDGGDTACGKDGTGDGWWWPL